MTLQQTLKKDAQELAIVINDIQLDKFQQYYTLLVDWNEKVNLTSITEPTEVARKHFLDSLLLLKDIDFAGFESIIDVGTGAGFPGLPLKIMQPHLKLTLLDSLKKRCNFLEEVTSSLNLDNVQVIHARAEDAAQKPELREKFDLATARAVANLRIIAEYCLPFVKVGGYFIAPKGKDGKIEADEAVKAIDILGARTEKINTYSLPFGSRNNVVIKKHATTPKKYPRKAGLPEKKPL